MDELSKEEMSEIGTRLYEWDVERFLDDGYQVKCNCEGGCQWMRDNGLVTDEGITTRKGVQVREFMRGVSENDE